jgi:hypothetical protein
MSKKTSGGSKGSGLKAKFNQARKAVNFTAAWASYIAAVVGGAALAAVPPGRWIGSGVGLLPGWVSVVFVVGPLAVMIYDVVNDLIPNQPAVLIAILGPSITNALPGEAAGKASDLADKVAAALNPTTSAWLGSGSAAVIAAGCITLALVWARKSMAGGAI